MPPRTFNGFVDRDGRVRIDSEESLPAGRKVLVTILDEAAVPAAERVPARAPVYGAPWQTLYAPLRLLGRGGMGETHVARDRATGRVVCVKQLLPTVNTRALLQECRALARLEHPFIVRLLNLDTSAREPYMVTEYMDGPTLGAYLATHLPADGVVHRLARRLFEALAFAHGRDVLHCDLKPGNVLLQFDGSELVPRIIDFGLAVVDLRDDRDAITAVGRFAGTASYMPPEQFAGRRLTGAADVYAVGQMLWEMLMDRQAFCGPLYGIAADKLHRRLGSELPDAPWPIDDAVATLVSSCTEAEPAGRPTAREALDRLPPDPVVPAPAVLAPFNLTFSLAGADGAPRGWFNSEGFVDGVSTAYDIRVVVRPDGGACLQLQGEMRYDAFGSVMQRIPAGRFAGRQIRFEADLAGDISGGWAGLWLRADDALGRTLIFDNMSDRQVRGQSGWARHAITKRLPPETAWLNYGALLAGSGTIWIDDVKLEALDARDTWRSMAVWDEAGSSPPTSVETEPTT